MEKYNSFSTIELFKTLDLLKFKMYKMPHFIPPDLNTPPKKKM